MEAGRRTETYSGRHTPPSSSFLNLPAGELASVIFGCNHSTYSECVSQLIFGLPHNHISYVKNVQPGMPLFLFNYSDRKLHGIFEAESRGKLNINPLGWTDGRGETSFPAQVRVRVRCRCLPLSEKVFKEAIAANYQRNHQSHFYFELNHVQTDKLMSLFARNTASVNSPYINPRAVPLPFSPGGDEKVWVRPEKSVIDAWNNAAPFMPPSAHSPATQSEKRPSTPEHWYEDQENLENEKASEEVINQGCASEVPLGKGTELAAGLSLDWRENVLSTDAMSFEGQEDYRKLERECDIVEKLNQLKDRGKQISIEVKDEGTQVQEKRLMEASGSGSSCVESQDVADSALIEWERLARERCLQEQTMLQEECEQLKEKLQALDAPVARAITKNLELFASTITQMRQDQGELLKELEQLRKKNATLENTQVCMVSELVGLKSEIGRLSQQLEAVLQCSRQVNQSYPLLSNERDNSETDAMTVVESQQKVYLIGGQDTSSCLDSVDALNPATHEITSAAPMSTARSYAAACVLMGSIFVFGGRDGNMWFETVEMYNQERNEWTLCSPMRQKKGGLAGATVGERIYAIGGRMCKVSFSEVECYDAHLGMWIRSTSMLSKRFDAAAAELNGALYAIGGYNEHYLASVERFDPREALWTAVAPMTRRRQSLSAVSSGGKIYAIGGYDGTEFLKAVEYYEPRRNCWIEMDAGMNTGRACGAVARTGQDLYMFGGYNSGGYMDTVEWYTEGSAGWEIADDIALGTRRSLVCAVLE